MQMEPIGVVRSPVTEPVDGGWGDVISEIHLEERLAPGLRGLEQFSHLLVVFFIHRFSFAPDDDLVRHPRGREDLPLVGIFAQRAKHRPNPIGITAVPLLGVEGSVVRVRGLDAIDGTPVLDLKPYFPDFDRVDDATIPYWVGEVMKDYF